MATAFTHLPDSEHGPPLPEGRGRGPPIRRRPERWEGEGSRWIGNGPQNVDPLKQDQRSKWQDRNPSPSPRPCGARSRGPSLSPPGEVVRAPLLQRCMHLRALAGQEKCFPPTPPPASAGSQERPWSRDIRRSHDRPTRDHYRSSCSRRMAPSCPCRRR